MDNLSNFQDISSPEGTPIPIPSDSSDGYKDYRVIGWCEEALNEGQAFLQSQPNYEQIRPAIESIISNGSWPAKGLPPYLSQTRTNRVAKISEDLAAILTDMRPFWEYKTANRRFEQQATINGKLSTHWYQMQSVDMRLASIIKYSVVAGTGYGHLVYNPTLDDMELVDEDPRNVIPIRPNSYQTVQNSLGVCVKRFYPVNYFWDRYKVRVKPEADALYTDNDKGSSIWSPLLSIFSKQKDKPNTIPKVPGAWLKILYLDDRRKNKHNYEVEMGKWGDVEGNRIPLNNWSYKVKADEVLYPNKRMIVWVQDKLIYDGPSYYWHGQFPVLKFTLSPWPWSYIGKAPVWDILPLQNSLNQLLRIVDDHAAQVAQPGAIFDKNNTSRSQFATFNTRRPGWKVYQDPLAGKGIQIVNPPALDQAIWKQIDWIINEINTLSGVVDISQLTNLGQIPANDTVEAMMNSMTPANRYRSRNIETFCKELAEQQLYNFAQFYTLPKRCAILGAGGITMEDFDFDPGSLIPDYVHDEDFNSQGQITPEAMQRGPLPRYDRAKIFLKRLHYGIAPGSALESAQLGQKMMYLMLGRSGLIDMFTMLEKLDIPNVGVLPDNVRTIIDRLQYQQQLGFGMNVSPVGRKATAQSPPQAETKGDGRVVMSESG